MFRILPLLFLLVGCAIQPISEPRRPSPENEPTMVPTAIAIEKPTYTVEVGSVASQLFKSGRITPVEQTQLSFPLDGRLATLLVSEGELVNAGDVIATLDTVSLEQGLDSAESDLKLTQEQQTIAEENKATDLRRAEIGVELAQLQLDYVEEEAGPTPTADQTLAIEVYKRELELAQLNLDQLDNPIDPTLSNQIAQFERQIETINTQIAQSTLIASTSGTIMTVNVAQGDRIAAQQTIVVIADLTNLEAQIALVDRDLQELSEGLTAFGTIPSRPETTIPMTIRQLPYPYGTGAQGDDADSVVSISFDNATQLDDVRIGDRIEITILLEQRENVLWLPPTALREFNGRRFVVVQEGQTQRRLDIKIGLQNENQIEIISGVTEGQLVVGP